MTRKNKFKKTLISIVLITSFSSNAAEQVSDPVRLGHLKTGNIQAAINHEQLMSMLMEGINFTGKLMGLDIDNTNNGFSNLIIREGKSKEDVQNLEILRESAPANNACGVLASKIVIEDSECSAAEYKSSESKKRAATKSESEALRNNSDIEPSKEDKEKGNVSLKNKLNDLLKRAKEAKPEFHEVTDVLTSDSVPYILDTSYLFGSFDGYLTLTKDEQKAVEDFILLVAPPYIPTPEDEEFAKTNDEKTLIIMNRKLKHNVVGASLTNILSKKIMSPDGGPSLLENLSNFSGEYYGEADSAGDFTSDVITTPFTGDFGSPLLQAARISSVFDMHRLHPVDKVVKPHRGVDYAVGIGTQLVAPADGVVVTAGSYGGAGLLTVIKHANSYKTRYMHQSKLLIRVGDKVEKGQLIGLSGNTGKSSGPHLHYEVLINDTAVDPLILSKDNDNINESSPSHNSAVTDIQSSSLAVPASIQRDRAIMNSFQIRMSIEELKTNLNKELILATMLSNKIREHEIDNSDHNYDEDAEDIKDPRNEPYFIDKSGRGNGVEY